MDHDRRRMGDEALVPTRRRAQGSGEGSSWLRAIGRRLRDGKGGKGSEEAASPEPERKTELSTHRKTLSCPECGAAAIIRDKGNSVVGIGFCGHEYILKVVRIHCAAGHKLDALDEEGSVHQPGVECNRGAVE